MEERIQEIAVNEENAMQKKKTNQNKNENRKMNYKSSVERCE